MRRPVLIVDDSVVARLAIKRGLKKSGMRVIEAVSGEEALELIKGGLDPALVFLDLTMPGMGGLATLRLIREAQPGLKVVVVTADLQSSTFDQARAIGVFGILRKPASTEEIADFLNRATGGSAEPC